MGILFVGIGAPYVQIGIIEIIENVIRRNSLRKSMHDQVHVYVMCSADHTVHIRLQYLHEETVISQSVGDSCHPTRFLVVWIHILKHSDVTLTVSKQDLNKHSVKCTYSHFTQIRLCIHACNYYVEMKESEAAESEAAIHHGCYIASIPL